MNPRFVAWLLTILLICSFSDLLAQTPIDPAEERLVLQRQCRAWLRSAHDLRKQGRSAEALAALDSVLQWDAKNPDAYFLRSQLLTERGDTTGAIDVLHTGVAQAPLSMRMKIYLARLLISRNETEEAASLIDAVLVIRPHEGEALFVRGRLDMISGNEQSAMDHFEQALKYGMEQHGR